LPFKFTPSSTSLVVDAAPKDFDMIVSRFKKRRLSALQRRGGGLPGARSRNKRRMPPFDIRREPPLSKRTRKI
jgi:hypothetical protein